MREPRHELLGYKIVDPAATGGAWPLKSVRDESGRVDRLVERVQGEQDLPADFVEQLGREEIAALAPAIDDVPGARSQVPAQEIVQTAKFIGAGKLLASFNSMSVPTIPGGNLDGRHTPPKPARSRPSGGYIAGFGLIKSRVAHKMCLFPEGPRGWSQPDIGSRLEAITP